jgi:serine/threonine-protein kinase
MNPDTRREIEDAVRDALGKRGMAGMVVVQPGLVELVGGDRPSAIEIGSLVDDWPAMSAETRASTATDLARRLFEATLVVRKTTRPPMDARRPPPVTAIAVVVLVVIVGIAVMVAIGRRWLASTLGAAPSATASDEVPRESDAETNARLARVCEATRKRVYAGASVGPMDVGGWVAELWLAKKSPGSLSDAKELRAFVEGDKVAPSADAEIAKVSGGKVELVDATSPELGKAWHAAVLRFSGRYLDGYLDPSGRARFIALAGRVATAAGADMGALYGRCAHLPTHEIGAWYFGSDAPSTSAALLVSMGLASDAPTVDKKKLSSDELDALRKAGADLDPSALGSLVGVAGGNVTTSGSNVELTFPVGGPIRATNATRAVAHRLKVETSYSPAE